MPNDKWYLEFQWEDGTISHSKSMGISEALNYDQPKFNWSGSPRVTTELCKVNTPTKKEQ